MKYVFGLLTAGLIAAWAQPARACRCKSFFLRRESAVVLPSNGQKNVPCDTLLIVQQPARFQAFRASAGAGQGSRHSTIRLFQSAIPLQLKPHLQRVHGRLRTQFFSITGRLKPSTDYRIVVQMRTYSRARPRRTVRFRTGVCRRTGRVSPPRIRKVKIRKPRFPGPSCGTGRSSVQITFKPGKARGVTAPVHALYHGHRRINWSQPVGYVISSGAVGEIETRLGSASVCARAATDGLPGGRTLRFGVRAIWWNGTPSPGRATRSYRMPRILRRGRP